MTDHTDDGQGPVLRAKEAFMAPGTSVAKGDLFRASDPIVAGREHLFEPVAVSVRASVPGPVVSPPPAEPKTTRKAKAAAEAEGD